MKAVVPFKTVNAKSRLSAALTPDERTKLARLMLD
ncbi:MAG TPA: 2-phospho-L-lactate guanylyltransferase, partial [Methanocella sp.]|nr:2-phospho-L-lactate guanylyltransferase [Methanocella sp.]